MADTEFYLTSSLHLCIAPEPLSVADIEKLGDEVDRAEWLVKNMWDDADHISGTAALDAYEEVFYNLLDDAKDAYRAALDHAMHDELASARVAPMGSPAYLWCHRTCAEIEANGAIVDRKTWRMISQQKEIDAATWRTLSWREKLDAGNALDRALLRHDFAYRRYRDDDIRRAMVKQRISYNQNCRWRRVKPTPTKYVRDPDGTRIPRSKIK
jgi:hypothetical protein